MWEIFLDVKCSKHADIYYAHDFVPAVALFCCEGHIQTIY